MKPENPDNRTPITYEQSGVNYSDLDRYKIEAQKWAAETADNLRRHEATEVPGIRGESAYVWDKGDYYLAATPEGVGTKNLVADEVRHMWSGNTGRTYYDAVAIDTVATMVNDLITVGAMPEVVLPKLSVADARWFNDRERVNDFNRGWQEACDIAGAAWGSGETSELPGIIVPGTIELSGSAVGTIYPKERLMHGGRLEAGDAILLLGSSGIHANGSGLARQVASKAPANYATGLEDGSMYGESLLIPTEIYVDALAKLFEAKVDVHYAVNITGHGWRKLMRANREFTYAIEAIPPPQPVFNFIQAYSGLSDKKMYATFNMGAGFAFFIGKQDTVHALHHLNKSGYQAMRAGEVQEGPRQVIINPKQIVFPGDTLAIR